jgi:tetratricopeptide (TPR) repeat protein
MKYILLFTAAMALQACSAAAPVAVQNTNAPARDDRAQNTIAHGPTDQTAPVASSNTRGKWTQGGDPIDTTKYDKAIADAEKNQKSKPADVSVKQALAQAYFERGFALTESRQYASALGDYRRALKLDPNHEESKKWMDQILSIYEMLKKEAPKEGEEPPPLPMQKPAR